MGCRNAACQVPVFALWDVWMTAMRVSRPRPDGRVLSEGTGEMWQLACLAVRWQSLGGGVRGSADQGGLLGFGLLRW